MYRYLGAASATAAKYLDQSATGHHPGSFRRDLMQRRDKATAWACLSVITLDDGGVCTIRKEDPWRIQAFLVPQGSRKTDKEGADYLLWGHTQSS